MQLIKEEYPMLKFLKLVSYYEALQELSSQTVFNGTTEDDAKKSNDTIENYFNKETVKYVIRAIGRISCFRHLFINILSMPLGAMKFEQKMRDTNYKVWWIKLSIGIMNFLIKLLPGNTNAPPASTPSPPA